MGLNIVLLLVLYLGNCFIVQTQGNMTLVPENTTVKVNQSASFMCSLPNTSKGIQWYLNGDTDIIYAGRQIFEPFKERFNVLTVSGITKLIISSVRPEDEGQYICVDEGFQKLRFSAFLTVLDSDPVCKSNIRTDGFVGTNDCGIVPDVVELSCSITFHGGSPPKLSWWRAGGNHAAVGNITSIIYGNKVTYTLRMTADLTMNNSSYLCQTTQLNGDQLHCQTDLISIINIQTSTKAVNQDVGDEMPCSHYVRKNCSHSLQKLESNGKVPVAAQISKQLKEPGNYSCSVTCIIRGVLCVTSSMLITVRDNDSIHAKGTWHLEYWLPILLIVMAITVAIGLLAVLCRRNRIRDTSRERSNNLSINLLPTSESHSNREEPVTKGLNMDKWSPALVCMIKTKPADENDKPIYGIAILNSLLYIATGWSSVIEVRKLDELRSCDSIDVQGLVRPFDLVSCSHNQCIYILDFKGKDEKKEIFRLNADDSIIGGWFTEQNIIPQTLSVTNDGCVIFSTFDENVPYIYEYYPDGMLRHKIKISIDTHIIRVLHVIKLSDDEFLISHGSIKYKNRLHRVCLVKLGEGSEGKVLNNTVTSFGGITGPSEEQLNVPAYMVKTTDGSIMVADRENGRILLLDSKLKFKRVLLCGKQSALRCPLGLCIDDARGLLFVADNQKVETENVWHGGRILVFGEKNNL